MWTKKNSLLFKTLINIIIFSIFILLFVWLIQVAFYNVFYEKYTIRKMENIKSIIIKTKINELPSVLESVAYDNNICIEVTSGITTVGYNLKTKACALGKDIPYINDLKLKVYKNVTDKFIIQNKDINNKALLYGINKSGNYIFVYTALEDINTTSNVLRGQLIYITIIVMLLSIIIAYYISIRITKPIIKITNNARKLGEGDYSVKFEKNDINEIDELADTLNYVTNELNKTNEIRNDLMANVSHDLKTPLTMIKAYAEMVKDFSYKDDVKRNENIEVIIKETDRLNILVNDILDLNRLQQDKDILNIEKYDLVIEIKDIINKFSYLDNEGYKVIYEGIDSLIVSADKSKINQVVYNLINNAINYTGEDKNVFVKLSKNKKDALVEIIDTGKGIEEKEIKYIWEKYYKNEKNHRRNIVGTGLGLSIVKEILISHKYKYGVKSKKGKGSTFYFVLKNVK